MVEGEADLARLDPRVEQRVLERRRGRGSDEARASSPLTTPSFAPGAAEGVSPKPVAVARPGHCRDTQPGAPMEASAETRLSRQRLGAPPRARASPSAQSSGLLADREADLAALDLSVQVALERLAVAARDRSLAVHPDEPAAAAVRAAPRRLLERGAVAVAVRAPLHALGDAAEWVGCHVVHSLSFGFGSN